MVYHRSFTHWSILVRQINLQIMHWSIDIIHGTECIRQCLFGVILRLVKSASVNGKTASFTHACSWVLCGFIFSDLLTT